MSCRYLPFGMMTSGRIPAGWLHWNVQDLTMWIIAVRKMNGTEKAANRIFR